MAWVLLSVVLLYLFHKKRKFQPLRFRTFAMTMVLWSNLAVMVTLNLTNISMDMTGSCALEMVATCICLWVHLFVYIMKELQLAHVYHWSEMKLRDQPAQAGGLMHVTATKKVSKVSTLCSGFAPLLGLFTKRAFSPLLMYRN